MASSNPCQHDDSIGPWPAAATSAPLENWVSALLEKAPPGNATERSGGAGPAEQGKCARDPGSPVPTTLASDALLAAAAARAPFAALPEPRHALTAMLSVVERTSYEVEGEVASGGTGRIRKARDHRLSRQVALKELLFDGDPAAEERFVREAMVTARLQHPSIVPIYEAGRWPSGEPFYAMKLVSGRSLADVIRERASLEQRFALLPHVLAAAEAMAYAHSEQIIHRDLKPSNILVGSFGETVVIDWGLAKDLGRRPRGAVEPDALPQSPPSSRPRPSLDSDAWETLTMTGEIMGTPAYMPPEQARGASVDERADVYALGAMLYHVLAGVPPYEGTSAFEILHRVAREAPPPLEQRQRGISPDLLAIVHKAMARDPGARYRTAGELASDLRRFQTGQFVAAHHYSRIQILQRFVRRYKAPVVVAAAALALLMALGVMSLWRIIEERDRAAQKQLDAERAEQSAVERADALTLMHARAAVEENPNQALSWLRTLSPTFDRWPEARLIASDARERGLATLLHGHAGAVNAVAFSPDGRSLATASDDHTVRLWDMERSGSRVLTGHTDEVYRVAFSPDGRAIASASKDGSVRLWDARSLEGAVIAGDMGPVSTLSFSPTGEHLCASSREGRLLLWDVARRAARVLRPSNDPLRATAFSPDGRLLASGGFDGALRLWDVAQGTEARTLGSGQRPLVAVSFSPDGKAVATRDLGGTVQLWSVAGGPPQALPGSAPTAWAQSLAGLGELVFSPNGATVASVGEDAAVRLWSTTTRAPEMLRGHEGRTLAAAFSPDGARLATGSYDRTLRLWDLSTGESRTFHGFEDAVIAVAFSPDGKTLAAAGADHDVRIFRMSGHASRVLDGYPGEALGASFSADGKLVVTAHDDGAVRRWDVTRGGEATVLGTHGPGTTRAIFSPDGEIIASTGADGAVRLFHRGGGELRSFAGDGEAGHLLAFSPDSGRVAWAGAFGVVHVGDVRSGAERSFEGHERVVAALAFSPDGQTLASAGLDRTVRLWSLDTGEGRELRGHDDAVLALAFSPDGQTLASGSLDHTLRFWTLATGDSRSVNAGGSGITQIAFSRDSATAITVSKVEASLRLWDVATARPRGMLRGHAGEVMSFALSPDGSRIATASVDRTVRLWDAQSGESRVLRGHAGAVIGVSYSPDGRLLATVGEDGTTRIWLDDLPREPAGLRAFLAAAAP